VGLPGLSGRVAAGKPVRDAFAKMSNESWSGRP